MPQGAARRALSSDWFEHAIRFGHAAKGVVFGMIGVLALRLALGDGGEAVDFAGVLEHVADQPLDLLLLSVLSLGLFAYAAWRFAEGLADLDDVNGGVTGWASRGMVLAVGLTYAAFGVYAIGLILGMRMNDDGVEEETATVLQWPLGEWLVGAVGVGVLVAGLYELYIAFSNRFKEEFRGTEMATWESVVVRILGWWGHTARGAVYGAAGFFTIRAAVRFDPDEARGVDETLWELGAGAGPAVLVAIAAGFIALGLYSIILALHRHIPDPGEKRPEERTP